jgi:hypothetical protein
LNEREEAEEDRRGRRSTQDFSFLTCRWAYSHFRSWGGPVVLCECFAVFPEMDTKMVLYPNQVRGFVCYCFSAFPLCFDSKVTIRRML